MSKTITLKPRLNEKTYAMAQDRVYVFSVDTSANKHSIARAVEEQFEVKVEKVNTVYVKGKAKRTISLTGKRMVNSNGKRADIKKAYVTLAEGHALPFFDAIDEEIQKEAELQTKVDKAVEKKADKETKKVAKKAKKETK